MKRLSINVVMQSVHDVKPQNAIEAKFAAQGAILYAASIKCMKSFFNQDMIPQSAHYGNLAVKFMRFHNETVETLSRYCRGGEQMVVVQHQSFVQADKAIVNHISVGEWETRK
jgi:hypothetical protein